MEHTIAALGTPPAKSAIAVVRLSGADALGVAGRVFRARSGKTLDRIAGYTALYGDFFDGGELLDDGVAMVYRAPKSYTGEDMVELSCHGNPLVAQKLVSACIAAGAAPAANGEFTRRAFENGKIGLAEAEAVAELIEAESEGARRAALTRKSGALTRETDAVCEMLSLLTAKLAVWSDYPEETDAPEITAEELEAALREAIAPLRALAASHRAGEYLQNGVTAAIVGRPNVGKSTLLNRLAGQERAIVTDVAGTTRDVVEAAAAIGSFPLRLLDTAGIRETDDPVEQIGVNRAKEAAETADLVLLVLDSSQALCAEDFELLQRTANRPRVIVANKDDLPGVQPSGVTGEVVSISAKNGAGFDALGDAILRALGVTLSQDHAMIASERQYGCVLRAIDALEGAAAAVAAGMTFDAAGIAIDDALDALGELTGRTATDMTLAQVFEKFCVGK
jgi:tRNA modification GTPase